MPRTTILLNWVYHHQVGHAIEAFKVAQGLYNPNDAPELHVLLNSRTPVELAEACPWITRAWSIDLAHVDLGPIPRHWDYVVTDHRASASPFEFAAPLRNFHDQAAAYFEARIWKGPQHQLDQPGAPAYQPDAPIRMRPRDATIPLPEAGGLNFAVVLAGSSPQPIYPSPDWWTAALHALSAEFPEARLFVTGKSAADDRSNTLAYDATHAAALAAANPAIVNAYDIGLWNQLALLERCDILISPHTGFSFLGPAVGTPWLSISGASWPECFFNELPFYSLLPDCDRYPCWMDMKPECRDRIEAAAPPVRCVNEELAPKILELLQAAHLLLDSNFTYTEARALYQHRIQQKGFPRDHFFQIR